MALGSRSIDSHEPGGRCDQRSKNSMKKALTTRFGSNCGSPGGGVPLGFTASVKRFTSWPSPNLATSTPSSEYPRCFRTLESKNNRIRGERCPFLIYRNDNGLRRADHGAKKRSVTHRVLWKIPLSRRHTHQQVIPTHQMRETGRRA